MQQMPQISPAYDRNQRRAHLWPEQGLSGGRSGAGQGKCAAGPEHTRPDVQHLGYKKRDLHANTLVKDNVESNLRRVSPDTPRDPLAPEADSRPDPETTRYHPR